MDDLSNMHENEKDSSGKLLTSQEKIIFEQIAAGEPPHSQRAEALLAIDAGVTQKIAALQSGQTVGQVSYWLNKFRRDGLGIFPDELLRQTEVAPSPSEQLKDQSAQEAKLEKKEKPKKKLKKGKTKKKSKKVKATIKKKKGGKKRAKKSKKKKKKGKKK